ncbi:hypothetical protein Tco_0248588 [Tanacetum coccineum]
MTFEHNSSGLVLHQMVSAENNTSGPVPQCLVPQGQKASHYDNSDPVPPRQNVVPTAEKTDSSQQGLEFLISTDKSKITRKQSKTGKHGHENQ